RERGFPGAVGEGLLRDTGLLVDEHDDGVGQDAGGILDDAAHPALERLRMRRHAADADADQEHQSKTATESHSPSCMAMAQRAYRGHAAVRSEQRTDC